MKVTLNRLLLVVGCLGLALNGLVPLARAQSNACFAVQTKIESGVIEGLYDTKTGLQYYLGIPFAQPPVGALRWQAPQPVVPWEGVIETKQFGLRAVQAIVFGDMGGRSPGLSEDCLYLNVWTPAKRDTTGLPVLVYFYGGGFVAGDGAEPRYDGAAMAQQGIVVVTVNYRLGVFGFLALPELSAEAPYHASGNYGLLDQNAALQWVRANIAAFGGDPAKVTIAGESAGSISVSIQMASLLSKGLIAGAIGESGAAINPTLAPVPLAEAERQGLEFAKAAGNLTLAQLRALSTREVYELYTAKRFGFPTVLDGYLLPKSLPEIFRVGEQAQVPLLVGWNSAEIPGVAFMQGLPYTAEDFVKKVRETYPDAAQQAEVLKLYPHGSAAEVERAATDLASDRFIAYSTWKWADLQCRHSAQPVYRYLYCKVPPRAETSAPKASYRKGPPAWTPPPLIGAPHACEIEYCMGNLDLMKGTPWIQEDYDVSETMMSYFANFIKTGNPNGKGLPEWPAVSAQDPAPPVMHLDVESKAVPSADEARYEFLDTAYGNK